MAKAKANPWSGIDLSDPDQMQQVAQLGFHALATGKISKEKAVQNAKALGLPVTQSDGSDVPSPGSVMAMGIDPAATGPLSMQAGAPPSPGNVGQKAAQIAQAMSGVKNPVSKVEEDINQGRKSVVNRQLTKTPEDARLADMESQGTYPEVQGYEPLKNNNGDVVVDEKGQPVPDRDRPIYDFSKTSTDPNHPYQQQKAGIDKLQELADKQAYKESQSNHLDWTPIMQFGDFMNGFKSNTAAHALKPTPSTTLENAFELQKRRGDLAKDATLNAKNLKGGSALDQLTQALVAKESAGQGQPGRGSTQQENAFLSRVTRDARDLRTQDQVLTNVSRLLAQWNPSADPEVKTQIARLVEGTVRPQLAVIGASGGDQSFWQRLMGSMEKMGTGQMTAEQRGQYMREIQALKKTHDEAAGALRTSWAVQNQRLDKPFLDDELQKLTGMATPGSAASSAALSTIAQPLNVGKPKSQRVGAKIRVSNGKETLMIDPKDEADAAKDGYTR